MTTQNSYEDVIKKTDTFSDFVDKTLEVALEQLKNQKTLTPSLIVVTETDAWIHDVPDGAMEMAKFFVDSVEKYRPAKWYLFLTETWAINISSDDKNEVKKYLNNPEMIVDNPFKVERVSFRAQSQTDAYEGYINFERGEDGNKIVGELVFTDPQEEHYANVADLLLPMVQ